MNSVAFNNCIVILGKELEPYFCRSFEVTEGRVSRIDIQKPVNNAELSDQIIIPGLWNGHTHIGDSFLVDGATGLSLEEGFFRPNGYKYRELAKVPNEILLASMVAYQKYMLKSGCVGHLDFREQGAKGAKLLAQASRISNIQSIILSQFNESPFDSKMLQQNQAKLPPAFIKELDEILDCADGFSESTMNDLTDDGWQQIKEVTEQKSKIRAIHCLENENYRDTSIAYTGKGDLERALAIYNPHLIVHLTVANDEEIKLLKNSQATVVINPRANTVLGLPLPPVAKLLESGVNLLLGTDNVMLNSPNLFAEMDFTYKVCKSQYADPKLLEPKQILKMCTSNMDKVPILNHPGYLDIGLPANFAVLDFGKPHLKHTQHLLATIVSRLTPEEVVATYINGKLYE